MNDNCAHEEFIANVKVNRLTNEGKMAVIAFSADIAINCKVCGHAFEFIGVEPGVSPFHPTISIDSKELRAPIKPATGQIVFEATHRNN